MLVVTDADREALLAELPGADVHVVPNVHEPGHDGAATPAGRDGLLFVGNFRHPPNGDAVDYLCNQILPLVRRELPGVKLTIVGDSPPPAVQALAGDGVEVTGWVPETEPYLASHRLSVAPLRFGAGMKGKVGEALAAGLPVVTTTIGAEGMVDAVPADSGLAVADDPQAFADAVVRLIRDDAEWTKLAEAGRAHVARHYGHAPVAEALERLLAAESTRPVLDGLTSIVILAHGELELTRACLDSIAAHTPERHELILVDNGSPDDTAAFLERYAAEHDHVRVVLNRRNARLRRRLQPGPRALARRRRAAAEQRHARHAGLARPPARTPSRATSRSPARSPTTSPARSSWPTPPTAIPTPTRPG